MRVLVCGGRNFTDREAVFHELHQLAETHGWVTVIEGGAQGADALARLWAQLCYQGLVTVHAEWKRLGKGAGPARNTRMLVSGKPDLVLAFPGGKGTADMVRQAREVGVQIIEIPVRDISGAAA